MATVSNFGINELSGGDVPLDAIPFAAVLINSEGKITSINAAWAASHSASEIGQNLISWCGDLHGHAPELYAELRNGIRQVLDGQRRRFEQQFPINGSLNRIAVSACSEGALILHQDLGVAAATPQPATRPHRLEILGRLVGGVSHDFANLLTLISGYSDILLERLGPTNPVRSELDEIHKAALRGARLTGQLLGFTRGQTAQPVALDLNAIVMDTERMLAPILGEHIEVKTALCTDLGRVTADPGQMEQVLMNLILNARDAMPSGGEIRIETANGNLDEAAANLRGIAHGPCVLISITDSGHGIEPGDIDRIFQPFFTTKESGKGFGLGLDTVHHIVRQSGGAVWVHSQPGEGACFTVCFPRAGHSPRGTETPKSQCTQGAGSETVLLVEDEEAVRKLLSQVLRRRGYDVVEASCGQEALRIFSQDPDRFHLVLTDIVMPNMNGRQLGERIRGMRPHQKVIYMSGYTDDVLANTGALAPGMSFLQKPLRPDVLTARIREALDARG